MHSPRVTVAIDLERIRANAEAIRAQVSVPIMAVVKADAYGLGAAAVADVIGDVVDEFACFALHEAQALGRPGVVLGPPDPHADPATYVGLNLRQAISTRAHAERFRGIPTLVNLDTGMQRFGCAPAELPDLLAAAECAEVFTHAAGPESARRLADACRGLPVRRHAAASALLDCPDAWLDGVRPGLALYLGALAVTTRLLTARDTRGPVGYTGFECPRIGVIPAGYAQGLAPGAAVGLGGSIERVLEVGMNTAYVSAGRAAREGDPVTLLGRTIDEAAQAAALAIGRHEVICRFAHMGPRTYVGLRSMPEGG